VCVGGEGGLREELVDLPSLTRSVSLTWAMLWDTKRLSHCSELYLMDLVVVLWDVVGLDNYCGMVNRMLWGPKRVYDGSGESSPRTLV
jgi:hypothetical protein